MKKETKPLWLENPDRLVEELKPEECHAEAFGIEGCLRDNDYDVRKCLDEVATLHACCELHRYKSKHCANMSGLMKQVLEPAEKAGASARDVDVKEKKQERTPGKQNEVGAANDK